MIALINGSKRTGSTLVYQLTKDICEAHSKCYTTPYDEIDEAIDYGALHYVCKIHDIFPPIHKEYFRVIATIRNIYDSVYSSMKMWPVQYEGLEGKELEAKVIGEVKYYKEYQKHLYRYYHNSNNLCLILHYEHIYNDNVHAINSICKFLNIDLDGQARKMIALYNSIDTVRQRTGSVRDPNEIAFDNFRKGHISENGGYPGYGKHQLNPHIKKIIEKELNND